MKAVKILWRELEQMIWHFITYYPSGRIGLWLRRFYYKKKIGKDIGERPVIEYGAKIFKAALVKIGDRIQLGEFVIIDPSDSFGVIIGNDVGIAHNSYLRAGNHEYADLHKPILAQGHMARKIFTTDGKEASIIIEDDVWIGANTVVVSGVKIGRGSIIAAGSVVMSEIPPFSMAMGNPARVFAGRGVLSQLTQFKFD